MKTLPLLLVLPFLTSTSPRPAQDQPAPLSRPGAAAPGKAPIADKPLSPSENKSYRKALSAGRKQHAAKDYTGAIKSFQEALAISPDDPRALNELGWAAFFAKDYALAEESTRKSLERSSDPSLRGASFYNLGRILEEQGKSREATVSYVQSLEARPNKTVRERLATLDATAAARFDPLKPAALRGPYATLDEFCAEQKKDQDPEHPVVCALQESDSYGWYEGALSVASPASPYRAIRVVGVNQSLWNDPSFDLGEASYHLAIQTTKGWFLTDPFTTDYNPGAFGIQNWTRTESLALKDVIPGGNPELLFRFTIFSVDANMAGAERYYTEGSFQIVCGIGSSGPACTAPILLGLVNGIDYSLWEENTDELGPPPGKSQETSWALKATFTADGKLELKEGKKKKTSLPKDAKDSLGQHVFLFP